MYAIAAMVLLGAWLVGYLVVSCWVEYVRDKARVSKLSIEELREIIALPSNAEFRFAYMHLKIRGDDVRTAQESWMAMLASDDAWQRRLGLERLREVCPQLRHGSDLSSDVSLETLQERVQVILDRNGHGER